MEIDLSDEQYKPPKVDVLQVQVEFGFGKSDDPLYDFGTYVQDMPGASL